VIPDPCFFRPFSSAVSALPLVRGGLWGGGVAPVAHFAPCVWLVGGQLLGRIICMPQLHQAFLPAGVGHILFVSLLAFASQGASADPANGGSGGEPEAGGGDAEVGAAGSARAGCVASEEEEEEECSEGGQDTGSEGNGEEEGEEDEEEEGEGSSSGSEGEGLGESAGSGESEEEDGSASREGVEGVHDVQTEGTATAAYCESRLPLRAGRAAEADDGEISSPVPARVAVGRNRRPNIRMDGYVQ
jgi:hypothetical protein